MRIRSCSWCATGRRHARRDPRVRRRAARRRRGGGGRTGAGYRLPAELAGSRGMGDDEDSATHIVLTYEVDTAALYGPFKSSREVLGDLDPQRVEEASEAGGPPAPPAPRSIVAGRMWCQSEQHVDRGGICAASSRLRHSAAIRRHRSQVERHPARSRCTASCSVRSATDPRNRRRRRSKWSASTRWMPCTPALAKRASCPSVRTT